MKFGKYFEIMKMNFLQSLTYFYDSLFKSIFVAIILFIFIQLWGVIYSGKTLIEGYTFAMVIWYLVLTESIVTSSSKIHDQMSAQIVDGSVAYTLNKPISFILFMLFNGLGNSVVRFVITLIVGSLTTLLLVGGFEFQIMSIPFLLIVIMLAIIIINLFSVLIGLFAFWTEQIRAIDFIYQKLVFTIGGMLIPLQFFPLWVQNFSIYLPFSFIAYHPARFFVNYNSGDFGFIFFMQIFWIILLFIVIFYLYSIGVRRVAVNGG